MFEDDKTLEELRKRKEISRKSFKKSINKDKIDDFEMDEIFNDL
ncbi:MAG: hypothetical protein QF824_02520 [Candidatus Woesearchaeota archaeon]|jgi:hypothetical protein|nr:hypothetical protein [Candidatus Woesearchaeota archaeon]